MFWKQVTEIDNCGITKSREHCCCPYVTGLEDNQKNIWGIQKKCTRAINFILRHFEF